MDTNSLDVFESGFCVRGIPGRKINIYTVTRAGELVLRDCFRRGAWQSDPFAQDLHIGAGESVVVSQKIHGKRYYNATLEAFERLTCAGELDLPEEE